MTGIQAVLWWGFGWNLGGGGGWSGDRVKVNQENWDSFEPAVTFVVTN